MGWIFKVSIFIPEKYRAEALNLPLTNEMKKNIETAEQIGKLKFFSVIFELRSDKLFNQIYTLIDFKKLLK